MDQAGHKLHGDCKVDDGTFAVGKERGDLVFV